MAELIEMSFGVRTWVCPRKHVLIGAHWRHLANMIELSTYEVFLSNYVNYLLTG